MSQVDLAATMRVPGPEVHMQADHELEFMRVLERGQRSMRRHRSGAPLAVCMQK